MTPVEILTLAADAAKYDAVVFLWATSRGTQPVLLPRSLGTAPRTQAANPRLLVSGRSATRRDR